MEQQINVFMQFTFSADASFTREELEKRIMELFKSLLEPYDQEKLFPMVECMRLLQLKEEAEIYGKK